ncbi:hypothetical protein [Parabacteroides sp. PF5-6]|uniref:hypothetical protein n=1 Tax=Parabacteroides sp. PF5-6 TaxID=1742403 RepID=UPI002405B543|nr:hypothetical protein [Parabacteroides sp. PF5-6]MDF9830066.1 hypothetical protein [Parabacteroides sp. PF5-6]
MDLDQMKKEWQETPLEVNVGEEKIGQMIGNEGRSAFRKLLRNEQIAIIVAVLCALISGIFKYPELVWFYRITIALGFCWQIYKVVYLRRVDLINMSILEISRSYIRYRKMAIYEIVLGLVWFWAFTGLYAYLEYIHNEFFGIYEYLVFGIIFGLGFLLCLWTIWRLQWRHIRQLGRSIREVQELEKGNEFY